ncbi:Microtubule-associated protein, microtubule dynamics during spindle orientation [Pseudocyphellaria aurata]|nr:Microtubule-associated protein, microtubule dynamics during spindle orientation [Pseudocyphellaria aurata]
MADQEEDFSSLPLPDRFAHKNWKVRKQGYEDAAKAFETTPDESDPTFRPFILDSGLWKGAVADSNVAAQQEGINALCAFLKFGGAQACTRSRNATISPIVEKGLSSTRAATKQSALEALLLYIELDKSDPIIEDLLPSLANKQPKIIATTLAALTAIFHSYGVKIVDPKPVLKSLPKAFGHADKNVRAEASNLAAELFRWLRDSMKTLFWNELKPVQQQDLEKLFDSIKQEPAPKQERLQRSQQAAITSSTSGPYEAPEGEEEQDGEQPAEMEAFDLAEPIDVLDKAPKDLHDNLVSSKWKDRKEALDAFYAVANVDRIKDGSFDEIIQGLAKCIAKDANIAVVTVAANCVDVLAKGLRKGFAKYRGRIMGPIMERLKEKKQTVADALGQALDSVFGSTGLTDCLEDILEFLKHKNPQVKLETLKFLIRCLKTTREAPSKPETKSIADAATKLLTESSEVTRSGGAEALGTLMKIMGERAMGPYLESLDDIRKAKIKEYFETAQVKAKDKPKPIAPPPKTAPPLQKRTVKKGTAAAKKPAPRESTPQDEPPPKPTTSRSVPSKLGGPKPVLATPGTGLKMPKKLPGVGGAAAPNVASPRRNVTPPTLEDDIVSLPKLGRGLAGRPLAKPTSISSETPLTTAPPGMASAERAELEELRADKDRLQRTAEDLRSERSRLTSQIHELQHQNAQLIEDHTRNVLSIKAKETQLVRARSDAEAAEETVYKQQREIDRLKRELSRTMRANSPAPQDPRDHIYRDTNINGNSHHPGIDRLNSSMSESRDVGYQRARSYRSSPSDEKENSVGLDAVQKKTIDTENTTAAPTPMSREMSGFRSREGVTEVAATVQPVESWKRAAEVTSQLKARIEQMKAKQGLSRPH